MISALHEELPVVNAAEQGTMSSPQIEFLHRLSKSVGSSGIGVTYSCEQPCGCLPCKLDLRPLEEYPVLGPAEPSPKPQ